MEISPLRWYNGKVMLQGEGLMDEFIRSEKQIRRKQAVQDHDRYGPVDPACPPFYMDAAKQKKPVPRPETAGSAAGGWLRSQRRQKLIVYTSHKEEVYGPIIREFEERTGIWVEVRDGGSTELLEAIGQDRDSRRVTSCSAAGSKAMRHTGSILSHTGVS